MSEVVENVSEQQNSAPSCEAAQSTEAVSQETTNNVELVEEAVPAAIKTSPTASTETGEESLQKPAGEESSSTSPKVDNKKTPVKRTRMSFIERAQKESEELVRTLGGSLEMEGGRRTRSSTRGTPTRSVVASTPPPAKKSRNSPASGSSTPTRGRGRGRKIDTTTDGSAEEENSPTTGKKKTPAKGRKSSAKESLEDHQDDEKKEDIKEIEKKPDDSTSATCTAKEDNVDAEETAKVVSAEPKTEEVLDETEAENNKETVTDEVKTEMKLDKEEHKTDDKTDAALEPVVEETQSQLAAETVLVEENIAKEPEKDSHIENVIEESKNNDSPMETVIPKESEENEKQNVKNINAIEAVKEPTPEPMEVDSNSKSNEAFDKIEDEIAEIVEEPQTSAPAVKLETSSENTGNLNDANTAEENVQQNSILMDGVAPLSSNTVENNIASAKLVNEPTVATNVAFGNFNEKSTEETTPAANNDLNKTENDLCEPKIAISPPISAANDNGTVTTPQTCN